MNDRELVLRRALSIPDDAKQVLVLEQSAHCDWDWLATFRVYYGVGGAGHQAVRDTLAQAIGYIGSSTKQEPYTYVFCEVAYIEAFVNDPTVSPDTIRALRSLAGKSFLFSSGGITSAENLTVHTEAFIRNYLVGRQWLHDTFGVTASNQMWIPDDFGHDAQLPVLLQAMGFTGAGFWRIPAQSGAPNAFCTGITASSSAASSFLPGVGLDFIWQAADKSQVQAHWLSNGYCEGNAFGTPPMIANGMAAIAQLIEQNTQGLAQPTSYLFVPIDCDFTTPYSNLPQVVAQWNAQPKLSTTVVMASFDDFMQLVAAANGDGGVLTTVPTNPASGNAFVPHPYYSGCYGSKPFIKTTHYKAVRTLLLAESMQLVLQNLGPWYADTASRMIAAAWHSIAPSTHHDFIPGTAPNAPQPGYPPNANVQDVYNGEQVVVMKLALAEAEGAQAFVLSQIADAVAPPYNDGNLVLVANSLGFERTAVADLAALAPGSSYQSSTVDSKTYTPVQSNGSGGLLIQAEVGALGYATVTLSNNKASDSTLSASQASGNGAVTMANGSISAVIDATGITSLTNPADSSSPNYLNGTGNQIVFYSDTGNIYRFANEMPCLGGTFQPDTSMVLTGATITLTESGPLRATAVVSGGTIGGIPFTITYQLYATDTALRIIVTGAAASGYSVMARFPFASAATQLTYGTTAHWDTRAPREFLAGTFPTSLEQMTFEPTHEFVAAIGADDSILGAIYHYATPAWAIDTGGAVIGCILRNTPGGGNAAAGSDFGVHTVSYAVTLPVGLKSPAKGAWRSGAMLAAALDIHNPLVAVGVPLTGNATLPPSMSIASVTDKKVLLTVAKAGTVNPSQMVLRIYQPTNDRLTSVDVTIDATIASLYQVNDQLVARAVTALEQPSNEALNLSTTATTVTLDLPFAITTIALG